MSESVSNEKLKQELCKLKPIVPRKKRAGYRGISYNDVAWFLLNYYKKKEGIK